MRTRPLIALAASTVTVVALIAAPMSAGAATTNLAPFGIATASSSENDTVGPQNAIDGDAATRWSSAFADPQTLTIDLGALATVDSSAHLGGGARVRVHRWRPRPTARWTRSTRRRPPTAASTRSRWTRLAALPPDDRHRPGHGVRLFALRGRGAR